MAIVAIIDPEDSHVLGQLRSLLPESAFLSIAVPADLGEQMDISLSQAFPHFTERQRAILPLLAQNMSNKEIGRALTISHFTVRNHVSQILRMLNVRSRKAAVTAIEQRDGTRNPDRSMAGMALAMASRYGPSRGSMVQAARPCQL